MLPMNSRDLWYNRPDALQIDFTSFLHPLLPSTTHKEAKQKIVLSKKCDDMLLMYAISPRQLCVHSVPTKQEAASTRLKTALPRGNH